jgi:hypothetical protein
MLALRQKDAYDNKRADLLAGRGAQRVATQMVSKDGSRSGVEDYHHRRADYTIHVRQQARQRWREENVTGCQQQRKDHRQPVDTHRTIQGQD